MPPKKSTIKSIQYDGGTRRSRRVAQRPDGFFSEQAQQERNESSRKELEAVIPSRSPRKRKAPSEHSDSSRSRLKELKPLPKPEPLNKEAFMADLKTDYTEKMEKARAKPKLAKNKVVWGPVKNQIDDLEKVPKGWTMDEPDLDPNDFTAQIARCKERIREKVMPTAYENKLKELLKLQKGRMDLMSKMPDVSLKVALRLKALEGSLAWVQETGDEFNVACSLEAIIDAYKSGSLDWVDGLVTYWNKGVQLCQPRPFDWREFYHLYALHKGSETGFHTEGLFGPGPLGQNLYFNKFTQWAPDPTDTWAKFIEVKICLRAPPDNTRNTLPAEFSMIDDTGASMMQIYAGDVDYMRENCPMTLIDGPFDMPPLLGVVVMVLADGTENSRYCRAIEANLRKPNGGYAGPWEPIPVSIEPGDAIVNGHKRCRLNGPWLRWRLYTATVPHKTTLNVYSYNPSTSANNVRKISDAGTVIAMDHSHIAVRDEADFPDTRQLTSSCPFCNKSFQKPEVTRRHSKNCAKKSNQPAPPAAKPGRKRQSCDLCFFAKASCDKGTPCSRCRSFSRECTFSVQHASRSSSPAVIPRAPSHPSRATLKGSGPFSFLRHFADPSFQKDRLAIGETAKCSVRRNLETLHSHIEDALVPTDIMSTFGDFQIPSLPFQLPSNLPSFADEYFLTQFNPDVLFPSKLSTQLSEIMAELAETSKSMGLGSPDSPHELDFTELSHLLDVSHISASITAFFQSLHWHLPVVHFPTFDPGNISNSLLLSIFLSGATYTTPLDGKGLPSALFDVAEEYIFRQIASLSTFALPKDHSTIQLIQSALIIEMLQFGRDNMQTRRRIRIVRHPCLVSTIRSLGIFQLKREATPDLCDEGTWRDLVAEEVCIRIACWVFLADGFLTVCFKNHPSISVFEMNCNFPWSSGLWEAESASSFSKIATSHSTERPLPRLSDVVTQLLEKPLSEGQIPWSLSISVEHLLILIYEAINSVAFQVRAGLLKYLSLDRIRCASSNWKRVWDSVIGLLDQDRLLHLGYPKHAQELWWLLNATLEATGKSEARLQYMDNSATDDLGDLNEFIQWCYQSAPQLSGY
ncbi:unnamed protein product [Penicillium olsonii]|nr:unnamed protein product [Penicillium olsonii]